MKEVREMGQFDSTLEVIYQRVQLLEEHEIKCRQAASLLEEGLLKSDVQIDVEIASHRRGFVGVITAYIPAESALGETEVLAFEEIGLKDPRGVTQIVETVLNNITEKVRAYL